MKSCVGWFMGSKRDSFGEFFPPTAPAFGPVAVSSVFGFRFSVFIRVQLCLPPIIGSVVKVLWENLR
jgi:hypothetical protein